MSLAQTNKKVKGGLIPLKEIQKKKNNVSSSQAKTAQVSLPGRSVNYFWDDNASIWIYTDSSLYTYNAAGLLTNQTNRSGFFFNRTVNTYDAQGRTTEALQQNWDLSTNQWENSFRIVRIYDAQSSQIENRFDLFNLSTNVWEISSGNKNIITYNASNLITTDVTQTWNQSLSIWEDDFRITNYIYNSNGAATQYDFQIKNGANWDNDFRIKDTYDLSGKLVDEIVQTWSVSAYINSDRFTNVTWHNWTGSPNTNAIASYTIQEWGTPNANQWNTSGRSNATYDNFGGSVMLDQTNTNSVWVNDYRYSIFFDNQYINTGFRQEVWQTTTNSWDIDYEDKFIHTYDASNNITQTIWQYWDLQTSTLVNNDKKVYSNFQILTGLYSLGAANTLEVSLYPNPFTNNCTLRLTNQKQEIGNDLVIKLFDVFGKEVSQTNIVGEETQIERGNLPSGIYFYSVMDKNMALANGKLVIE